KSGEGEAPLASARRLARCGASEGPPARLLRGAEGVASSRPDRGARRRSPTVAGPIPRGVPLHRVPDPAAEDAGRAPGENPEAADIARGGARIQRIGRPI